MKYCPLQDIDECSVLDKSGLLEIITINKNVPHCLSVTIYGLGITIYSSCKPEETAFWFLATVTFGLLIRGIMTYLKLANETTVAAALNSFALY